MNKKGLHKAVIVLFHSTGFSSLLMGLMVILAGSIVPALSWKFVLQ